MSFVIPRAIQEKETLNIVKIMIDKLKWNSKKG